MSQASGTPGKPKVAWIAVEPTPFHMPLFEFIRNSAQVDIRYYFCSQQIDQPWDLDRYAHLIEPESNRRSYRLGGLYFNPAILGALRGNAWDAVVVSGYAHWTMQASILWCLARGVPFLLQSDTHLLKPRGWLKRALKRAFLFPVLRQSSAALGLGRLQREYFLSIGIPPERLFTVPLTSHLDQFMAAVRDCRAKRGELRQQWGIPEDATVAVFVGRLVPEKALDVLLEGLALVEPGHRPHLLLVGDGEERSRLEQIAVERQLPVTFAGFQQNHDLPAMFAAGDFFVLPSRREAWGLVVAEAMASGLPVVLSDQVGAAYDLLEEGRNGFLVPAAGGARSWAEALRRCLDQPDLLAEMGRQSLERIGSWTCAAAGAEFVRAIRYVLG